MESKIGEELMADFPIGEKEPTLAELAAELVVAKTAVMSAKLRLEDAEEAILKHPEVSKNLKPTGVNHIGPLVITTGENRRWDQEQLAEFVEGVDPHYWPFRTKYEEDRRKMETLAELFPDLVATLSPALTIKPKKPVIKLGKTEEPTDGDQS